LHELKEVTDRNGIPVSAMSYCANEYRKPNNNNVPTRKYNRSEEKT